MKRWREVCGWCLALALTGCATTARFEPADARLDVAPYAAADGALRSGERVVWGGMIIEVKNRADDTEIVMLGYPLDRKFRPVLKGATVGRFIVVLPGYVERFDYPQGRFLTVRGALVGTREELIEEKPYLYPIITGDALKLWPAGYQNSGPVFSIGIGVGIGH
jgi:outer membrane lipoprotein